MQLQNIYYIVSIIFMTIGIVLLIVIGVVLVTIRQKLVHLSDILERKLEILSRYASDPGDAALQIGTKMASRAFSQVKKVFSK